MKTKNKTPTGIKIGRTIMYTLVLTIVGMISYGFAIEIMGLELGILFTSFLSSLIISLSLCLRGDFD